MCLDSRPSGSDRRPCADDEEYPADPELRFLVEATGLGRLKAEVKSCSTDGRFEGVDDVDDAPRLGLDSAAKGERDHR